MPRLHTRHILSTFIKNNNNEPSKNYKNVHKNNSLPDTFYNIMIVKSYNTRVIEAWCKKYLWISKGGGALTS